jgi:hypothetical protein
MENQKRVFESPEQIAAINEVVKQIESTTGDRLVKLPYKYGVDFLAMNGDDPIGVIEIKCRDIKSDQYRDYAVSLRKCMSAMLVGDALGVPFVLYVQFSDGKIGRKYMQWTMLKNIRVAEKSNNERGDIEPLVRFETASFEWLKTH